MASRLEAVPPAMPADAPLSTYRLQFNAGFTFSDAAAIVDYLHALGVSHCYASSYLKAVPGSTHGYDVADPTRLNPELGDEQSYATWIARLRARGMGHILDFVPEPHGHRAVGQPLVAGRPRERRRARATRRSSTSTGRRSSRSSKNKVLLPVLGDAYGAVLERQEIQLEYDHGRVSRALLRHAPARSRRAPTT